MKKSIPIFLSLLAALTLSHAAATATLAATAPAEPAKPAEQAPAHPVKGVIMGIMTDKTALLVKHEEVPGVMRAMTMMFKVEPAVLERVKRGDAIQAKMQRRTDGWWLLDVEVTAPVQ